MFYIQETNYHKGIDISNKHYVLYQGTIVASYDEICDIIDALILAKTREIKMNKLKTKLLKLIEYINPDELSNVETFINDYKNNALNWLGVTLTKSGIINVKIYTVNIFAKHP